MERQRRTKARLQTKGGQIADEREQAAEGSRGERGK
jgi:hypothetical protein